MNIFGIGTDIVNINRVKSILKKRKKSFKNKVFTEVEIKTCDKRIPLQAF